MIAKLMKKNFLLILCALIVTFIVIGCEAPTTSPLSTVWTGTKLTGAWEFEAYGNAVATDASGNVYTAGTIKNDWWGVSNNYLDGKQLDGPTNFFVCKYDQGGNKLWTEVLGLQDGYAEGTGVAVDRNGNVYVCGYTMRNNTGFGPPPPPIYPYTDRGLDGQYCLDGTITSGVYTAFITKYNSSGEKQWTRLQGALTRNVYCYGIAIDSTSSSATPPDDYIYITGYTLGEMGIGVNTNGTGVYTTWFNGTPGTTENLFISKFDQKGNLKTGTNETVKLLGALGGNTEGHGIAVNKSTTGNSLQIFVTGFTTCASLPNFTFLNATTHIGGDELIVGFTNSTLGTIRGVQIPAAAAGLVHGLSIAYDGTSTTYPTLVHVVGTTTNGLRAYSASAPLNTTGVQDGFWIKLSFNTTPPYFYTTTISPETFGSSASWTGFTGCAIDSIGTCMVSGYTNWAVGILTYQQKMGIYDLLLMNYPKTNATIAQLGQTGEYTYSNGIAINSSNQVFLVGYTTGMLDGTNKNGAIDALVTKYSVSSSGNVTHY